MSREGIFRFIAPRGAAGRKPTNPQIVLYADAEESAFADDLRTLVSQGGERAAARTRAAAFRASAEYIDDLRNHPEGKELVAAFEASETTKLEDLDTSSWDVPADFSRRLADSVLADAFAAGTPTSSRNRNAKVVALKLIRLSDLSCEALPAEKQSLSVGQWATRETLPIPRGLIPSRPPVGPRSAAQAPQDAELSASQEVAESSSVGPLRRLLTVLVAETKRLGSPSTAAPTDHENEDESALLRFPRTVLRRLGLDERNELESLGADLDTSDPFDLVRRVESEVLRRSGELQTPPATRRLLMLGGAMLDTAKILGGLRTSISGSSAFPIDGPQCKQSVGIGDLLIVRQSLKAYELADFAHVENVLAGESRAREHRRARRNEEVFTSETETETQTERSLESAQRSEIQREIETTVATETSVEAGFQLSGSYGPSIAFSSNASVSFSASTEESARKAVTFSKEVTEKTAERIRKQIRESRTVRRVEEIEEINRHEIDNTGAPAEHTRGIYRWLNKVTDAQVERYGQRMLFEFVVPEPAAFFLHAVLEDPPENLILLKPDAPTHLGQPLRPEHLDASSYQTLVAQYHPSGVTPPPPMTHTVVRSKAIDAVDQVEVKILGHAESVAVPAGYEAQVARVGIDFTAKRGESYSVRVRVGGQSYTTDTATGSVFTRTLPAIRGEVGLSVLLDDVFNWSFALQLECTLSAEGLARWQHETYDAIIDAYQRKLEAFEEQERASQIQAGIGTLGRNPAENRRIAQHELRKLAIHFMTGGSVLGHSSFLPGAAPIVDVRKACDLGEHIRFLEQAFEWRNMQYVLYPYFWGRYARWRSALHITDADPDFSAFLTAGAARIQVPVRPGFEKAIAYYCQHGEPYFGEDPPLIDDDLYVPIADEIAENLGRFDDGSPYPEGSTPWEVRVPTDLVVLQDLEEVPGIRDSLTGDEISLGPRFPAS